MNSQPENCPKEYDDIICKECELRSYEMVSHPGDGSYAKVEKSICELGYWEDDF